MPELPRKTQKQIAQRYAGNLRYFRRLHPLRRARILLVLGIVFLSGIAAYLYLAHARSSQRIEWLNSSGAISQAHASFAQDCKKCHDPNLKFDPLHPMTAAGATIDASCLKCHVAHTFHQADVTIDRSCTACHHEHLGAGPMRPVADADCQSCHGNAAVMAASAQKALTLPASDFAVKLKDIHQVAFQPPRPPEGYTKVINSFATDHPDFQIQREHLSDPNTLKFDHNIHLTGDIPLVDGKKLDCTYCHKPDSRGAYMQPITFAANCQVCHSLQIDPSLPDFQIPHPQPGGEANSVRDFLLTLPAQYATYARDKKGLVTTADVNAFVLQHMTALRQRVRMGADLEKDVFFADSRDINLGPGSAPNRALFPGCAYCHEVKSSTAGEPIVTKPVTPDRWYVHAKFDHAAHNTVSCESCHSQARQSKLTSDVLLPDKTSCVACHSPKGGVVSNCVTCHEYHNQSPDQAVTDNSALRKMMLGSFATAPAR